MTRVAGPGPGVREVVVTHLEMTAAADLRPAREPRVEVRLERAGRPAPELSRFFYRTVGGDWYWLDRIDWSLEQWRGWVTRPGHELWTAWVEGVPAGYFELDRVGDECELAYFGLVPGFAGEGLGGWLLTRALERAWAVEGTRRVWVHTCELDAEAALHNYRARGLRDCATELEHWDLTTPSPGPWRGAHRPVLSE